MGVGPQTLSSSCQLFHVEQFETSDLGIRMWGRKDKTAMVSTSGYRTGWGGGGGGGGGGAESEHQINAGTS